MEEDSYPVRTIQLSKWDHAYNVTMPDERMTGPQYIPITRADMAKPFPKAGAIQLDWNQTGTMLLARFGRRHRLCRGFIITDLRLKESAPNVVHIYDFPPMKETGGTFSPKLRCVLVQARAVLSAKWNPVRKGSLILCTGSRSVYIWSDEWVGDTTVEGGEESEGGEDMAECVGVPAGMLVLPAGGEISG